MIHTLILDVGGTLMTAPDLFEGMAALFPGACVYARLKDSMMAELRLIGSGGKAFSTVEKIIEDVLRSVSGELGRPDCSCKAKEVYRDTFVTGARLFDDTFSTLSRLNEMGVDMLIASDADAEILFEELSLLGIGGFFSRYFISSELGCYKPGDGFADALRPVVPHPAAALFVGDSEADILTGRKLGTKTALIGGAQVGCRADYYINKLAEIIDIVGQA